MGNPLYSELSAIPYYPKLPNAIIETLKWRVPILTATPPRLVFRRPGVNDYIIHTDAAYGSSHGGIAALVFDPEFNRPNGPIRAIHVIPSYDPIQIDRIVEMFGDSSPAFGL